MYHSCCERHFSTHNEKLRNFIVHNDSSYYGHGAVKYLFQERNCLTLPSTLKNKQKKTTANFPTNSSIVPWITINKNQAIIWKMLCLTWPKQWNTSQPHNQSDKTPCWPWYQSKTVLCVINCLIMFGRKNYGKSSKCPWVVHSFMEVNDRREEEKK